MRQRDTPTTVRRIVRRHLTPCDLRLQCCSGYLGPSPCPIPARDSAHAIRDWPRTLRTPERPRARGRSPSTRSTKMRTPSMPFGPRNSAVARAPYRINAMFRSGLVFQLDQAGAAAIGVNYDATKELEFPLMIVGLPSVIRQELHSPTHGQCTVSVLSLTNVSARSGSM